MNGPVASISFGRKFWKSARIFLNSSESSDFPARIARIGLDGQLAFRLKGAERCAPTERCPQRGRLLRGEVHDENSAALGGVSGHAGLVGTLHGVAGFARALVERRLFPGCAAPSTTPPSPSRRG